MYKGSKMIRSKLMLAAALLIGFNAVAMDNNTAPAGNPADATAQPVPEVTPQPQPAPTVQEQAPATAGNLADATARPRFDRTTVISEIPAYAGAPSTKTPATKTPATQDSKLTHRRTSSHGNRGAFVAPAPASPAPTVTSRFPKLKAMFGIAAVVGCVVWAYNYFKKPVETEEDVFSAADDIVLE